MHHPTDRITHTTAFVTPVVEHWLEREIPLVLVTRYDIQLSTTQTNSKGSFICTIPQTG